MPSAPINVLARNIGNGGLEVRWDAVSGAVNYNIYIATSLGGPYVKANNRSITATRGIVMNIPFNSVVYAKVTAIDSGGVESAMSSAADDAVVARSTIALTFTAPIGSVINIGAMFAEIVGDGNLIAFRTTASGTV